MNRIILQAIKNNISNNIKRNWSSVQNVTAGLTAVNPQDT
jgi:hypothetical protein